MALSEVNDAVSPARRSPTPADIAMVNGLVGFVCPFLILFGVDFLADFVTWHFGHPRRETSMMLLSAGSFAPPFFVLGLACGLLMSLPVPRCRQRLIGVLLVGIAFAIAGAALAVAPDLARAALMRGLDAFVVFGIVAGCFIAPVMGLAARLFGAPPAVPLILLPLLGGAIPAAVFLVVWLGRYPLLLFLPALWLGIVTYFCLKPGRKGAATAFDNGGPVA